MKKGTIAILSLSACIWRGFCVVPEMMTFRKLPQVGRTSDPTGRSARHIVSRTTIWEKAFVVILVLKKRKEIVCALAINWALYSKNLRAFCNHPNIYGLLDIWSLIVWVFFSTFLSMDESSINSVCISGSVLCILVINVYGKDRCTDGQMS